jgi:hypothetical protein
MYTLYTAYSGGGTVFILEGLTLIKFIYVFIYLFSFVNYGRKPEYPGKTHDFRQSVDFYSFRVRTGFESH